MDKRGSDAAAKLRGVLAHAPALVFAIGPDGRFTLWDGRGPAALGLSADQVVGQSAFDLYGDLVTTEKDGRPISGADAVRRALGGSEFGGLCTIADTVLDIRLLPHVNEGTGEQVGVVGVATDVTGHARAEATLREARDRLVVANRLAAIGTLAAGAAHEINNPLTYALINLEHVLRQLRARVASRADGDDNSELSPLVEALAQAENGMERVRDVVRNLLTFSQGNVAQHTLLDVRGVLESSIQMAMHEIVHRARLVRDLGELPPVDANEAALGQVFLNLLVNAAQAIPEGDGREHQVRVKACTDPDGNALVEIADTGVGDPRGRPSAHLRGVLHDQGGRWRYGTRSLDLLRNGDPARRHHRGDQRGGPRNLLPRHPSSGGALATFGAGPRDLTRRTTPERAGRGRRRAGRRGDRRCAGRGGRRGRDER